jgi:hypothetical protein
MEHLDEIRGRLSAATPGPWEASRYAVYETRSAHGDVVAEAGMHVSDAEFIANAPTDVARLLNAVQAVLDLASKAPRFTVFGGESASGIVAADDVIEAITNALEADRGGI